MNAKKTKVKIAVPVANVRSGASTSARVVSTARADETFEILDTVGEWVQIDQDSWVLKSLTKEV